MGLEAFQEMKRETPISRNRQETQKLNEVGRRIASVASLPNAQWEFVVFDDPGSINAFAMPGGKVGVYTGLFQVVKTEADLALVIGHEVAHVAARHANERLSQQMAMQAGGLGVAVVAGSALPQVSLATSQAEGARPGTND